MFPTRHRQVLLAVRPLGIPQSEHFKIVEAPIPPLQLGELLIRNEFLSVEPAMRGWVNAAANYSDPVPVSDRMRSFAAGTAAGWGHAPHPQGETGSGPF